MSIMAELRIAPTSWINSKEAAGVSSNQLTSFSLLVV
jgi:hypothetical protein